MFQKIKRLTKQLYNIKKNIVLLTNKNIIAKQNQDKFYKYACKKYSKIIEEGIPETESVKPSNKVFILWLQGVDKAPLLVKTCIKSIQKHLPDKEIVILTGQSINDYISFPDYIIEKHKLGIIGPAHFSDLIRISLLCDYGGIWCDATCLMTETPPTLMTGETPLFVFKSIDLSRQDVEPTICSNWYISAWSNQKILLLTRKLLFEYWKESNKVDDYFIFHIFLAISARRYQKDWDSIPVFNNHSPHILQFEFSSEFSETRWEQIKKMSPVHKLNHHNNYDPQKNNYYKKILSLYNDEQT